MKRKFKYATLFFVGGIGLSIALGFLWLFGVASLSFTYEPINKILSNFPIISIFIPFFGLVVGYVYGDIKKVD